jgi:hypothetical protein
MAAGDSNLTDIHAQLGEVRCILLCTARSLAERQDPGDAEGVSMDVEDERVTILRAVTILGAAMDALDKRTP